MVVLAPTAELRPAQPLAAETRVLLSVWLQYLCHTMNGSAYGSRCKVGHTAQAAAVRVTLLPV
jgi:hypothetical protein